MMPGVNFLWNLEFPANLNEIPSKTKLFNCQMEEKICSGGVISLCTDD